MVIKRLIAGLVVLTLAQACLAEGALDSRLRFGTTELGKSLILHLSADDIEINLTSIDLTPLATDFHAELGDYNRDAGHQDLILKLAPRHTGQLVVPSLSLGSYRTIEHLANVLPASSGNRPLHVSLSLSSKNVVQREPVLASWEVMTPDRYATVRMGQGTLHGVELHPLPVERQWQPDADEGQGRLTIRGGWSLLPLSAGQQRVVLPALLYEQGGTIERRFHLPVQDITVDRLPPYVPPTMPVGPVSIESSISPAGMLHTDRLAYWQVTLQSQSLGPYWLPPVLQNLASGNDEIEFFPPHSKRGMHADTNGLNGRVTHRIPFKARANGRIALPELTFQYYDPDSRRIERIVHESARPWALGGFIRIVIGLVASCLLLLGMILLSRITGRYLRRRASLNAAIQHITAAQTSQDILAGLREIATALGWPGNLTVTDWARRWQASHIDDPRLPDLVEQLSTACYGASDEQDPVFLAETCVTLIRSRRRRYRWS